MPLQHNLAILLLITSIVISTRCYAVDDDWPYAKISCDKSLGQLAIEERSASDQKDIPQGPGIQDLVALTELKTINGSAGTQDYRLPKHSYRFSCTLNKSQYRIRILPWKFQAKINGMCGGYSPSIELTVWKDRKKLMNKFIFAGFCNDVPDIDSVSSVKFLDNESIAVFSSEGESDIFMQRLPYVVLPTLKREEVILQKADH